MKKKIYEKLFDAREWSEMEKWVNRMKTKGYKVWEFDDGDDSYWLLAAKTKPTKQDIEVHASYGGSGYRLISYKTDNWEFKW